MAFNKEIEMKFMVDKDKLPPLNNYNSYKFKTFYLGLVDPEIRVRVKNGIESSITIKIDNPSVYSRDEFSYPIPLLDVQVLELHRKSNVIEKIRYYVPVQATECSDLVGSFWEVDVYEGKLLGLVTAELEIPENLDRRELKINNPDWIGVDVTHINLFRNSHLSLLDSVSKELADYKLWKI